jgi:hypothetical protein
MYEKVNNLAIKQKEHTQQILTLDTWNHKLAKQNEETNLECKKIVGLIDTIERVQAQYQKVRLSGEEATNRFLMVENFVEKY